MSKLIVDNRTETLLDHECFHYINKVVAMGKISSSKGIDHYCHVSTFTTIDDGIVCVYFKLNKSSCTFVVSQDMAVKWSDIYEVI